jgi:hypothetical protein
VATPTAWGIDHVAFSMHGLAAPREEIQMRNLNCPAGPRSVPAVIVFALLILGLGALLRPLAGKAVGLPCGLTTPAFCDTFDEGPAAIRGRGGDLDSSKWSAARIAPSDFSGSGPVANIVAAAPIPACRASLTATSVYPPDDTLICDPSSPRSAQLMTAIVIQNYGNNSYMIRQPFDFANRIGKIVFDVDAVSASAQATYVELDLTEDPVPAPTFREYDNFETGPVPRNGLMMKWSESCAQNSVAITLGNTLVYNNYAATTITPSFSVGGTGCPRTRQGSLNHFEIQLSQTHVDVYGSDYSTDNGQSFPNFHKIYSANLSLPFTRGYVHVSARNHATKKYGFGPDFVYHWDNIGFDGPVISDWRAYEIPDNNTAAVSDGSMRNLGYLLLDGTTGKAAGIYDPINRLGPFQFQGVNVNGALGARLSLNGSFNILGHTANATWGWTFRFNGGTWRNRFLTPTEVQAINLPGSNGNTALLVDVPVADLRAGSNTLEMLPLNAPMDYPPVVANIDLILALSVGPAPPPPANLRVVP